MGSKCLPVFHYKNLQDQYLASYFIFKIIILSTATQRTTF